MGEIIAAVPGLAGAGVGGLLLLLVMYLLQANRADRTQHRETVTALRTEYREESKDFEAKIDRLETRIADLEKVVDTERSLRRDAQDTASRAESRAATAESQLFALREARGGADDPATTWLASPPNSAGAVDAGTTG